MHKPEIRDAETYLAFNVTFRALFCYYAWTEINFHRTPTLMQGSKRGSPVEPWKVQEVLNIQLWICVERWILMVLGNRRDFEFDVSQWTVWDQLHILCAHQYTMKFEFILNFPFSSPQNFAVRLWAKYMITPKGPCSSLFLLSETEGSVLRLFFLAVLIWEGY